MSVLWIDVSHHDWDRRSANLDWAKVKADTSPVMCARATYGDPAGFCPPTRHFADFQNGAVAAGFTLRGGYHNLVKGTVVSMTRQVEWFRSELDRYGCHWAMVDVERYPELVSNDQWPRWADVLRFRDAWYAMDSRPLVYYLPQWLVNNYYGAVDLTVLRGPLVQSHYVATDGTAAQIYAAAGGDAGTGWDDRYGGRYPDIWQFTSGANVAGASGNTDVNAYRGTMTELRTLLTGSDDHMATTLTPDDRVAIWTHDLADGSAVDPAYKVLNRAAGNAAAALANASKAASLLDSLTTTVQTLAAALAAVDAKVAGLALPAAAPVDPAALKAVLLDPEVLAALARAVNDDAARRQAE